MRKTTKTIKGIAAAAMLMPLGIPPASGADDAAAPAYDWSGVAIGGGGYVPGIVYNQTEPGLVYARTDIGGAYRLDRAADEWVPLLDHVGWDDWNRLGVLSLATDPVDTARVYAAVGMYTNDWDPNNGAILRSADYGETWEATPLPFKVGGNMPGRGIGERLQVDPNDNDVVYFGAEGGQGLWRSTDAGATFAQVSPFPNAGDFVPDAASGNSYLSQNLGVLWTAFDTASGSAGEATGTLFTAVADTDDILYRSDDAGATWQPVAGAPTGFLPHRGVIDEAGRVLYLTTSNTSGPYDGSDGQVWRYGIDDGTWTEITPPQRPVGGDFGFGGLTVDRTHPDTIMVAAQIQWWPDILFFRSTDRGATWTPAWDYVFGADGSTSVQTRYEQSIDSAPWLAFGKPVSGPDPWAEPTPKLGWMVSALEIDPFDPDELLYGTGATIYRASDLTAWDEEEGVIHIAPAADGIEETAIQDLVAPAGDVDLVSAMLDLGGFVHEEITVATNTFQGPYFGGATSVDAAGLAPAVLARAGTDGAGARVAAVSTDSGATWTGSPAADGATDSGTIAVTADGAAAVWAPAGAAARRTGDGGATWASVTGLPDGARVEADRVDASLVYGFSGGRFFRSTDAGATFAAVGTGLPSEGPVRFAATPGAPGEVWLAGGEDDGAYGLWRSGDAGSTWTAVDGFDEADTVGFGKAAPGAGSPTIFTAAERDGIRGIWRSTDDGATWLRINDDEHEWGWIGADIEGDPDVFGRVYVATNGRGIIVGDDTAAAAPAQWSSSATYDTGEVVGFDGAVWVASWWTRGQRPGGSTGPWQEVDAAPSGVARWTASRIFTAGDVVTDADGTLWRAQWWTRGQAPGTPWGPWEPLP
ncbi:xyloglucanase [Microbacterium sp. W1N]|uniref:xyloglucanase n=1 Tax=Microbacterium festucae TaxID=2977531 RepID=UPI0021C1F518|nr:xyloglucanase [Microbacterium festucae]MCT9820938.1 xyloglucanase [Microbacterium festucae]